MREKLVQYQNLILVIPFFLLVFGCGMESGKLLAAALVLRLLLCRLYHRPLTTKMWYSKLFRQTWCFIGLYLGVLFLTSWYTGGNLKEILHYAERMLSFLLVAITADDDLPIEKMAWYGFLAAGMYLCADTLLHYNFTPEGRLRGSFGWPLGLASILVTLLPGLLFGACKNLDRIFISGFTFGISGIMLYFLCLTGSRGGFLTLLVVLIAFSVLLLRAKALKSLVLVFLVTVMGLSGVLVVSGGTLAHKFNVSWQNDGRIYLMQVSKQLFEEHPLVGVGVKNWGKVYHQRFELPGKEKGITAPHNMFLQALNESGLLGLSALLAMLLFQLSYILKQGLVIVKNKLPGSKTLKASTGPILMLLAIIFYNQFDIAFYGRQEMALFWLCWGLVVYDGSREEGEEA